jgi:RNA polymerase sigma factor (sigma-70 family)
MASHRLAFPDLGRIFRGEAVSGLSEWQLLERYLQGRDETAFEALVTRHGPMVLGVCRRMLEDQGDVEDAFQATFLVLVRRAGQLGPRDAIGPWLYGVAVRVSLRARSRAARRRRYEPIALELPAVAPRDAFSDPDLGEVLDQELSRLPSKYRFPMVLCYLGGRTHEEAAQHLNWPVGTVKGRLARARDLLRSRLTRRGLAPTAVVIAALRAPDVQAALPRPLVEHTVRTSLKLAAGHSTAQVVTASITSLVEGVLTAMILNQLKWAGLAALVSGLALTGAAVVAQKDAPPPARQLPASPKPLAGSADIKAETARESSAAPVAATPAKENPPAARSSDPQQQLVQASRAAYQATWDAFRNGNASSEQVYGASRLWMDAGKLSASGPVAKVAAINEHLERMRDLLRVVGDRAHSPSKTSEGARIQAYVAEAVLWLAQGQRVGSETFPERGGARDDEHGPGKDPKSRQIMAKLEEPIAMSFTNETPLDDVLKYIKQATTSKTFAGVPIYVDPIGLQEAERSLNSTVTIDLEGVPLRRTLQLVLAQLGLIYWVEDGMIYITSEGSEQTQGALKPSMGVISPILERAARAERGELTLQEMEGLIKEFKARDLVMKLASGEAHEEGGPGASAAGARAKPVQMDSLLKELHELIELMNAERQAKKAAEKK